MSHLNGKYFMVVYFTVEQNNPSWSQLGQSYLWNMQNVCSISDILKVTMFQKYFTVCFKAL